MRDSECETKGVGLLRDVEPMAPRSWRNAKSGN